MHTSIIDDVEALAGTEPEWLRLFDRDTSATPFQHPAWLLAWARHLRSEPLLVVACWSGDGLAGMWPLVVAAGADGARVLRWLGHGITDYPDVLADPAQEPAVVAALWRALEAAGERWDALSLDDLSSASPLRRHRDLAPSGVVLTPASVCPVIDLPESVTAFDQGLPRGLKRNLRRYGDRLRARGDLAVERATTATLDEFMTAFFDLHASRWTLRGGRGVLVGPEIQAFHREASRTLLARGLATVFGLRSAGRLVSVIYTLRRDRRVFSYLAGFDAALADLSPGSLLIAEILRSCVADGIATFDFLRGPEAYKYQWGAKERRLEHLALAPRGTELAGASLAGAVSSGAPVPAGQEPAP